jgi:hypothetical protein
MEVLFEWLTKALIGALGRFIKRLCHPIEKRAIAWGKIITAAFGESKLQGLFCLSPFYAVRYASKLETQRCEIQSVIWDFVRAAAVRNLEVACTYCSPYSPTKEEIAGVIESSYDVFASCKLLTITSQSPQSRGRINTCYVNGVVTDSDNQSWPLEAWLAKSGDVWKITGIRIGLPVVLAARERSKKKTFAAIGVGVLSGALIVLGFVIPNAVLIFLGILVFIILMWIVIRQSR